MPTTDSKGAAEALKQAVEGKGIPGKLAASAASQLEVALGESFDVSVSKLDVSVAKLPAASKKPVSAGGGIDVKVVVQGLSAEKAQDVASDFNALDLTSVLKAAGLKVTSAYGKAFVVGVSGSESESESEGEAGSESESERGSTKPVDGGPTPVES